jgi:putative nucleotidyltransferase with HDIG domain
MIESVSRLSFREFAARAWQIVVPTAINGLIIAGATLVLVIPVGSSPNMLALAAGDVAPADITAPHSITYISKIQTDAARAAAIANTPDVFDPPDSRLTRQQIARARQTLDYISAVRLDEFSKPAQKINDLAALADAAVSPATANTLITLSDPEWTAVQNETALVIERALSSQIRADRIQETKNRLPALVSVNLSEAQAEVVTALATAYIVPNSLVNQSATKAARDAARDAVTPISQSFVKGQIIVNRGRVLTEADVEALNAFNLLRPEQRWQTAASNLLAVLISAALFGVYMARFNAAYFASGRLMIYFGSLFILFLLAARFMVPGRTVLPFLFPSAAFAMLVAVALGANVGMIASVIMAALVGVLADGRLDVTIYVAMGGIVAALMLGRAEHLNAFFWAGLAAAAANSGIILVFRLVDQNSDAFGIATLLAASLINGAISASATLALFFVLGNIFDITTSLQLIELARPNHPLLQFMLRQAPGTYQHSLQVANLAEQAAERIGANTTLVRVGALFHDVGKSAHPEYFVENQIGENPHDAFPPDVSAEHIINHVRDGLKMAARHRLPSVIRACIAEHHGDSITYYQYQRALKAVNGDETKIDKTKFRYPGPKPRSKETALLMLADGCEAKSRSDLPHNVEDIEKIVKFVFDLRLSTGQFDESNITLRELHLARLSFVETLKGFFHARLKYPDEIMPPQVSEEEAASSR